MRESNPKLPENKIAAKLLEIRLSKNKSQKEMAEALKISYPTYWQIEKGRYKISLKMLHKIANYLELSPTEVYNEYFNNENEEV